MPITEPGSGFGLSGGPLVARGKVMQGVNGQAPGGAYIVALDAQTGAEAWRFYTIARPGEPGGDSWNGLPLEQRTGGSVWTAGSYDAERNLAFFGPAPTYDTGPLRDPAAQRGVTNEALYTNATDCAEPRHGRARLALPARAERSVGLRLGVRAPTRQAAGSTAASATCSSRPARKPSTTRSISTTAAATCSRSISGLQNFITAIDPRTGAKTIDPRLVPSRESPIVVCPHAGGAKSWVPASINPATKVLFVPLVESCMDLTPVPQDQRGSLSTGVRWTIRPRLDSDGRYGRIQAIDLDHAQDAVDRAATRAANDGRARDGRRARVRRRARPLVHGLRRRDRQSTLAREIERRAELGADQLCRRTAQQYVAMTVGHGSAHALTFPMLTPEIDLPVVRSSTIWVFALPGR